MDSQIGIFHELRCPKEERQEMIIIQTPDAMRARVLCLNPAHEMHIRVVNAENKHGKLCLGE
jgi:hypothetical protein